MTVSGTSSCVWVTGGGDATLAADRERAESLGIAVVEEMPAAGFAIARDAAGLGLYRAGVFAPVRCALTDSADAMGRRNSGGRQSPLARALGLHRHPSMRVLDATAGLGRDALTLAVLGCPVTPIERAPALYALLVDATESLAVADHRPDWWPQWSMPIYADATKWLSSGDFGRNFDAIYIDPMFASPRRKSRPQKALSWLSELVAGDQDAGSLLALARAQARRRVVVKQHVRAVPLAPPNRQLRGRAIRFDIYLAGA